MNPLMQYTSRERWLVAISAMLGFGLDFYNLFILTFLFGAIQTSLHMTLPEAGTVVGATLAASIVGGVLVGWLGDKIGRKNALMATLLLLAGGALLSAFAWNYMSLLVFRVIAGVGVGGEWGAGIVLFNEVWNPKRRGLGSAAVQAMSAAGAAMSAIVAAYCLSHYAPDTAWRIAMGVGATPLLLMVLVRVGMPESRLWAEFDRRRRAGELPPEKARESSPLIEIFKGVSLRYFVVGVMISGGYFFAFQAVATFMPTLMIRVLGASPPVVRDATLVWSTTLAIGMLLSGLVGDYWGRKASVLSATAVGILAFGLIYWSASFHFAGSVFAWPILWAYAFWGLAQGAAGQFGCWWSELHPVELRSTATSTTYTTGRIFGALAAYLVPLFIPVFGGSLLMAMMIGAVGGLVSLVFSFALPETAGRTFDVIESRERMAVADQG